MKSDENRPIITRESSRSATFSQRHRLCVFVSASIVYLSTILWVTSNIQAHPLWQMTHFIYGQTPARLCTTQSKSWLAPAPWEGRAPLPLWPSCSGCLWESWAPASLRQPLFLPQKQLWNSWRCAVLFWSDNWLFMRICHKMPNSNVLPNQFFLQYVITVAIFFDTIDVHIHPGQILTMKQYHLQKSPLFKK